jgi:signal transduction histidine kinase
LDAAAGGTVAEADRNYLSLVIIPLIAADETVGLVQLKSEKEDYFEEDEVESYEDVAQAFGLALVNHLAHFTLHERVKELTCLYSLAQLVESPRITLEKILQGIVELLPPAWQYPEIAVGRMILDGWSYVTAGYKRGLQKQSAEIVVDGQFRGIIEVAYVEEKPELDEGPFLREERSLINALARQISLIIQRREADEDKIRLQDQLRHADRLATIGQLAAGVAHELNEPLGNILGFAQLVKKCRGLPERAKADIDKIETASLHAREVIKKLMIFARQMPPQKTQVNLNKVVEEGLYFLESRCAKDGIEVWRVLAPNLPEITADPAQLNQVLVNLVVNASQAMPDGGRLTVRTLARRNHVSLVVEDTGIGMSKEVMEQIFIPFFTTKDVGQGTGLGLPVVHGIVTSHGGIIKVKSQVGRGARFEIQLPLAGPQAAAETD